MRWARRCARTGRWTMQGEAARPRAESCPRGAEWEESAECNICPFTGSCIIGRQAPLQHWCSLQVLRVDPLRESTQVRLFLRRAVHCMLACSVRGGLGANVSVCLLSAP